MMYQSPAPLNKSFHAHKKVQACERFDFVAHLNSLPLIGLELAQACKEFPIFFSHLAGIKELQPIWLCGLKPKTNQLVDSNGQWLARYVPAFVRRYPFILGKKNDNTMGVCVDEAFIGFNDETGEALFDETGQYTNYLHTVIEFLSQFEREMERSRQFAQALYDADLLTPVLAQVTPTEGKAFLIEDLWVVNEPKLTQLSSEEAHKWLSTGYIGWIYSQLISLSNLNRFTENSEEFEAIELVRK